MKKIYLGLIAIVSVAVFANCGQNNGTTNGNAAMGATCYLMQTGSGSTMYGSYGQQQIPVAGAATCGFPYNTVTGFSQINGVSSYGAGYGGYGTPYGGYGTSTFGIGTGSMPSCGANQDVVYSPSLGLGCVNNTTILANGQPIMYTLSTAAQAFVTVSTPNPTLLQYQQMYNTQGSSYSYSYGSMGGQSLSQTTNGQVLRICSSAELCPTGQNCRSPFGPSSVSQLGICYF